MSKQTSVVIALALTAFKTFSAEAPKEWIDSDTGHRIVRLAYAPGSESLYFHQNAFTADGDKMVTTRENK